MTWSMHTQSYKAYLANLEASAISDTNVDVNALLVTWLCMHIDNAYRLGIVVHSKLNQRTSPLSNWKRHM